VSEGAVAGRTIGSCDMRISEMVLLASLTDGSVFSPEWRNCGYLLQGKKYSKTGIRQGLAKYRYMVRNPCVSERPYKLAIRIFGYFLPGTSRFHREAGMTHGSACTVARIPRYLAGLFVFPWNPRFIIGNLHPIYLVYDRSDASIYA